MHLILLNSVFNDSAHYHVWTETMKWSSDVWVQYDINYTFDIKYFHELEFILICNNGIKMGSVYFDE